jgi:hypothetical protein
LRVGDGTWLGRNGEVSIDFSGVPQFKEDPELGVEFTESLHRQRVLLDDLFASGSRQTDEPLVVFTHSWSNSAEPVRRTRWLDRLVPAEHFVTVTSDLPEDLDDDDPDVSWLHLWVSELRPGDAAMASLLLLAASNENFNSTVVPQSADWLFEPYVGGARVWIRDAAMREDLKSRHSDWVWPKLDYPSFAPTEIPGWQFVSEEMSEKSARRLLEVAEQENLLVSNGYVLDPRDSLIVELSREDAQLIRIALRRQKGEYFHSSSETLEHLGPKKAISRLKDVTSIVVRIDEFIDDYGYREPAEAIDGKLEARLRNPLRDYTGLDG